MFSKIRGDTVFASQGASPVSTTLAANFSPVSKTPAANLPPVSMTPVAIRHRYPTPTANLPPMSMTPVANNGNNIRLLTS